MRATVLVAALAALTTIVTIGPAEAASPPLSGARTAVHFDLQQGQTPENVALAPNGSVDVTFAAARQIAHVRLDGQVDVLATMPLPADGGVHTPLSGAAVTTGIARDRNGTRYVGYAAGDASLTGVWALDPRGGLRRIAALPATSFPNGLALDASTGQLYVADSALATIWRIPAAGGRPTAWARGSALARTAFAGSNGLELHRGAVWTTNTDAGTLVRFPIEPDGLAGQPQVRATGLTGVDDFAFTGDGDQVLAALFTSNQVAVVDAGGTHRIVLTAADGLQDPTAIAVRHRAVYVTGSARTTTVDPNLVLARLDHR